ncbi:MAG: hypothetical protein DHS80DRAFT_22549 [Piptocephalis tieghemiana]|nr:MAG: hypothetical protein DHS80DRAFT_22549 [Piptocephalis tieghemiana]
MQASFALLLTVALGLAPSTDAFPRMFSPDTKHAATTGMASGAAAAVGAGLVNKAFSYHKSSKEEEDGKKNVKESSPHPSGDDKPSPPSSTSSSPRDQSNFGIQTFTKDVGSDTRMTFFIETYSPTRGPVGDAKAVISEPMPGASGSPVRVVGDDGQGHRVITYIESRSPSPPPDSTSDIQKI